MPPMGPCSFACGNLQRPTDETMTPVMTTHISGLIVALALGLALVAPAVSAQTAPVPARTVTPPVPPSALPGAQPSATATAAAPRRTGHPLPPRRPAEFAAADQTGGTRSATADSPAAAASNAPAATPPAPLPLSAPPPRDVVAALPATPKDAVAQLNGYFNGITTLIGDFIQFGADGRRAEGKLYLQKPGRIRFEYRPPSTLEVVSDGQSVAIRDRRLATQDLVPVSQTPLKFLLNDRIDLARDTRVLKAGTEAGMVRVTVEDRTTLGGTSRITLIFDPRENVLKQWSIVDPQGFETSVALYNLDRTKRPDPALFRINYERIIDSNK